MADRDPCQDLGPCSDYTRVAPLYDGTRNIPRQILRACYERAVDAGLLPQSGVVLDAGCGTGQASLPLAEIGFEVVGYDASAAMARIAAAKSDGKRVRYKVGDVRRLPEPDGQFGAAVVSKLFQHVANWRLGVQEIVRVLQPEACIFVIDEKGPKNPIRERFAKALQEAGIVPRLPGTRDSDEVATAFLRAGCRAETLDVSGLRWTATFRSGDALDQLRDRLSAEFWSVADDDYERALAATLSWVEAQPGGREAGGVIEPHLSVSVFRTARPLNTANL